MTRMIQPDPPAPESDEFPVRFWRLLALGPIVGVASGTLSYILQAWLNPQPGDLARQYAILDDRERPYFENRLAA